MPDIEVGEEITLNADNITVITGLTMDQLRAMSELPEDDEKGSFRWLHGRFRPVSVFPHDCRCRRIEEIDKKAATAIAVGPEIETQAPPPHVIRRMIDRPTPPAGYGIDRQDVAPIVEQIDMTILTPDQGAPAGDVVTRYQIPGHDPNKVLDHPGIMRSPQRPQRGTGLPGGEPVKEDIATGASIDPRMILARMFLIPGSPRLR